VKVEFSEEESKTKLLMTTLHPLHDQSNNPKLFIPWQMDRSALGRDYSLPNLKAVEVELWLELCSGHRHRCKIRSVMSVLFNHPQR